MQNQNQGTKNVLTKCYMKDKPKNALKPHLNV